MDCIFSKGENEVSLYYVSEIRTRQTKQDHPFWMQVHKAKEEQEDFIPFEGKNFEYF